MYSSVALGDDMMKRVGMLGNCLHGATGVLCKEHPQQKGSTLTQVTIF